MIKLRITPNGPVLESEIIISNETLVRLTNPENAEKIKAALFDFGRTSHRLEESDNFSIMSRPIKDGEDIEPILEKLFKAHTGFIDWAQSLPAPAPTIDFKDEDKETDNDDNEEVMRSMAEDLKKVLDDDPELCVMFFSIRKSTVGVSKLLLSEIGIKALLNTFIEKYGEKEKSL